MKVLIATNTDPIKINHIVDAFEACSDLTVKVVHQNVTKVAQMSLIRRIRYKLKIPSDQDSLNKRLIEEYYAFKPDIVFISKGNIIKPKTLQKMKIFNPDAILLSWSLDDMYAWHNRSLYYTLGLKYYDHVFTTKSYNMKELQSLGAKNIHFLYQAYSKAYHLPCNDCNSSKFQYDVLFIGAAETERVQSLSYLASNGIKVYIYGGGWDKERFSNLHPNLIVHKYDLVGSDYAEAIHCSKISLCFLRKMNRDLHTSRSIEIPACGGFMIAEKTDEHLELFKEDKEAVYFETDEELLEKVKYYLEHEEKRKKIARAGSDRTRRDDYSYDDMVKRILREINL